MGDLSVQPLSQWVVPGLRVLPQESNSLATGNQREHQRENTTEAYGLCVTTSLTTVALRFTTDSVPGVMLLAKANP